MSRIGLCFSIFFMLANINHASAEKRSTRRVVCPPYVASLSSGAVVASRGKLKCFSSRSRAENAGFIVGDDLVVPQSCPPPAVQTPYTFSGTNSLTTISFAVTRMPATITFSHRGDEDGGGHFSIVLHDARNG